MGNTQPQSFTNNRLTKQPSGPPIHLNASQSESSKPEPCILDFSAIFPPEIISRILFRTMKEYYFSTNFLQLIELRDLLDHQELLKIQRLPKNLRDLLFICKKITDILQGKRNTAILSAISKLLKHLTPKNQDSSRPLTMVISGNLKVPIGPLKFTSPFRFFDPETIIFNTLVSKTNNSKLKTILPDETLQFKVLKSYGNEINQDLIDLISNLKLEQLHLKYFSLDKSLYGRWDMNSFTSLKELNIAVNIHNLKTKPYEIGTEYYIPLPPNITCFKLYLLEAKGCTFPTKTLCIFSQRCKILESLTIAGHPDSASMIFLCPPKESKLKIIDFSALLSLQLQVGHDMNWLNGLEQLHLPYPGFLLKYLYFYSLHLEIFEIGRNFIHIGDKLHHKYTSHEVCEKAMRQALS